MRKNLLWFAFIFFVSGITIASGYKPLMGKIKSKPVEKTVSLLLYKEGNYTSKVYKDALAEVYVSIKKVGNRDTIVWDTTFDAKPLYKYPSSEKALSQNVRIQNVIEGKEHLQINYLLTYISKGSVLKMQSTNSNTTIDTLVIKL